VVACIQDSVPFRSGQALRLHPLGQNFLPVKP
jgi:hypothetical protein